MSYVLDLEQMAYNNCLLFPIYCSTMCLILSMDWMSVFAVVIAV